MSCGNCHNCAACGDNLGDQLVEACKGVHKLSTLLREKMFWCEAADRWYCIDCGARQGREPDEGDTGWHTDECRLPDLLDFPRNP